MKHYDESRDHVHEKNLIGVVVKGLSSVLLMPLVPRVLLLVLRPLIVVFLSIAVEVHHRYVCPDVIEHLALH